MSSPFTAPLNSLAASLSSFYNTASTTLRENLPLPYLRRIDIMLPTQSMLYVAIWLVSLLALAGAITYNRNKKSGSSLVQWLERKRYQYEVTFSLYMMTPTEKFIFNSVLFLCLSLLVIATVLYGPEHVSIMWRRVTYYLQGEQFAAMQNGSNPTSLAQPEIKVGTA